MTCSRLHGVLLLLALALGCLDGVISAGWCVPPHPHQTPRVNCSPQAPVVSGCGDFTGMPDKVFGGQTVTLSIGTSGTGAPCNGNGRVFAVNGVNGKTWVVDGTPEPGDIQLSSIPLDANAHTVQFTMQGHFAPGVLCSYMDSTGQHSGPIAALGVPGVWETIHYFELDPAVTASVISNVTFRSGTGPGVNPGDTIKYTVSAAAAVSVSSWQLQSDIPLGTSLVPGSISAGGQLSGRTITWTVPQGNFSVTVDPSSNWPANFTQVNGGVFATATLPNGDTAFAQATDHVPVQQLSLLLEISPTTRIPGQVEPGETFKYTLTLSAPPGSTGLTLQDTIPQNTTLVPGSSTPAAQQSGNLLTWSFPAGSMQVTASFQVKLAPAASIPPGTRYVVDSASASAMVGTRSLTTAATNQLKIVQITLTINPPPPPDHVGPGDPIVYTINAAVTLTATTLKITDTLPTGTTLVDAHGGQVSGSTVTWTFQNVDTAQAMLSVRVLDAKHLPHGLTAIVDKAHADATLQNGDVVSADAINTLPLSLLVIEGTVDDVIMTFPASNVVQTKTPLAQVHMRLLQLDTHGVEQVIASAFTGSDGTYSFSVPQPGTYTVDARRHADQYTTADNDITAAARPVEQLRQATVPQNATKPVVVNFNLPFSLVNRAAVLLQGLNNLNIPVFGGAVDTSLLRWHFDTTGVESYLEQIISTHPDFTRVYTGSGPRDAWNGLIRVMAYMAVAQSRFQDCRAVADDMAKITALVLSAQAVKSLGKGGLLPSTSFVTVLTAQRLRIAVMEVVLPLLPSLLRHYGIQGEDLARVMEIVATVLRFGSDAWTEQFDDDLAFEVVFDTVRIVTLALVMDAFFGSQDNAISSLISSFLPPSPASPVGIQADLANVVDAATRLRYAGNTTTVLQKLNNENDTLSQSALKVRVWTASAVSVYSVFGGVNGVYEKGAKAVLKGGIDTVTSGFQAALARIAKITEVLKWAAAADAFVQPLVALYQQETSTSQMADDAFVLPVAAHLRRQVDPGVPVTLLEPGGAGPRAVVNNDPSVTAYLTLLGQITTAVQQNDTTTYHATLDAQLAQADAAMFGHYLDPLYARDLAALSGLTSITGTAATAMSGLPDPYLTVSDQCGYLYAQLAVWAAGGGSLDNSFALAQLQATVPAVQLVGTAAATAATPLRTAHVPGFLMVTGGDLPPGAVHEGDAFTLTFSVTNVGDQPTSTGVTELSPQANLLLQGTGTQTLPGLSAGQSTQTTWNVQATAGTQPRLASYSVIAATPSVQAAALQGVFAVWP